MKRRLVIGVVVAFLAAITGLVIYDAWSCVETVPDGVRVVIVMVGGKTPVPITVPARRCVRRR